MKDLRFKDAPPETTPRRVETLPAEIGMEAGAELVRRTLGYLD